MQYIEGLGLDAVLVEQLRLRQAESDRRRGAAAISTEAPSPPEPLPKDEACAQPELTPLALARSLATGLFPDAGPPAPDQDATDPNSS
jgi:hypothetical protein